ncbi:MAG: MFS transporter [Methylacidiphilales bacterium]|nr:MFS transporter [Candidatus Methylacidiphilales bacterium]
MAENVNPDDPGAPKLYHAGTLTYTKSALAILFFWLLWGDFCYTVMEAVTGPIMQLKFQKLGASNTEIGVILGTIPGTLYSILNPIISYRSDRFRSRWGRRIPFILFSIPFLVFFLVSLAFGEQVCFWVRDYLGFLFKGIPANQVTILTLGALLVVFTIFNIFGTSTFWFLFNDVTPVHLLARFMAWIRTIGLLSVAFYSYVIFPYSGTHSTEIFLGAALLYLVGFGLMCLNVKEGKYPPPSPYIGGKTGTLAAIRTYATETHAFPHYWYLWICTLIVSIGGGVGAFTLFFQLAIGLNMQQIGTLNGTLVLTMGILTIGAGWLADRYHPIRVVLVGFLSSLLIVTPLGLIWLFWLPPPNVVFWVAMVINIGLAAPSKALGDMWEPPMVMRLFPRSHYGQFSSVNSVWRAVGSMIGGGLTGAYLDFMTHLVGKERAYFYLPVWSLIFMLPGFYLFIKLYLSWKKHGGDDAYVAPLLLSIQNPVPTAVSPIVPPIENPDRP